MDVIWASGEAESFAERTGQVESHWSHRRIFPLGAFEAALARRSRFNDVLCCSRPHWNGPSSRHKSSNLFGGANLRQSTPEHPGLTAAAMPSSGATLVTRMIYNSVARLRVDPSRECLASWIADVKADVAKSKIEPMRKFYLNEPPADPSLNEVLGVSRDMIPRSFPVSNKPVQSVVSFFRHARVESCRYLLSFDTGVSNSPVIPVDQIGLIENVGDRT